jgi:hypothetical protein
LLHSQRIAIVLQACTDILACLDKIMSFYACKAMEYALWYRATQHVDFTSYSSFITMTTCDCIVNSNFWSSSTQWRLVTF